MSSAPESTDDVFLRRVLASAARDEPPAGAQEALLAALATTAAATAAATVSTTAHTATLKAGLGAGVTAKGTAGVLSSMAIKASVASAAAVVAVGGATAAWHVARVDEPAALRAAAPAATVVGAPSRSLAPSVSASTSPSIPASPTPPDSPSSGSLPSETVPAADVMDLPSSPTPAEHASASRSRPTAVAPKTKTVDAVSAAQVTDDLGGDISRPSNITSADDALAVEIALLAAAREALVRGDRQGARDRLTEYDARAPHGSLRREADMLWSRAR